MLQTAWGLKTEQSKWGICMGSLPIQIPHSETLSMSFTFGSGTLCGGKLHMKSVHSHFMAMIKSVCNQSKFLSGFYTDHIRSH